MCKCFQLCLGRTVDTNALIANYCKTFCSIDLIISRIHVPMVRSLDAEIRCREFDVRIWQHDVDLQTLLLSGLHT